MANVCLICSHSLTDIPVIPSGVQLSCEPHLAKAEVCNTVCGHLFHKYCLLNHLNGKKNTPGVCPTCNGQIAQKSIYPVYFMTSKGGDGGSLLKSNTDADTSKVVPSVASNQSSSGSSGLGATLLGVPGTIFGKFVKRTQPVQNSTVPPPPKQMKLEEKQTQNQPRQVTTRTIVVDNVTIQTPVNVQSVASKPATTEQTPSSTSDDMKNESDLLKGTKIESDLNGTKNENDPSDTKNENDLSDTKNENDPSDTKNENDPSDTKNENDPSNTKNESKDNDSKNESNANTTPTPTETAPKKTSSWFPKFFKKKD